jgi:hypothetical protein
VSDTQVDTRPVDVLDDGRTTRIDAVVRDGRVLVAPDGFAAATGWDLKPEGLCHGAVCVPLRPFPGAVVDGLIDAAVVAIPLQRAVVVDADAGVVAYAPAATAVADQLADRHAADFTLPSLDGTPCTFSALGRKKKLLVTWASW